MYSECLLGMGTLFRSRDTRENTKDKSLNGADILMGKKKM